MQALGAWLLRFFQTRAGQALVMYLASKVVEPIAEWVLKKCRQAKEVCVKKD